jgi:TolB protein
MGRPGSHREHGQGRAGRTLAVTALAVIALVLAPAILERTEPTAALGGAANERIAFTSDRDGNYEIYLMEPDGGGQTRVTNNGVSDFLPAWGCGGETLYIVSDRGGNYDIWKLTVPGGWGQFRAGVPVTATQITTSPLIDSDPSANCGNNDVVFGRIQDGSYDVIAYNDTDGERNLTPNTPFQFDGEPALSPDGLSIAFVSSRGEGARPAIFVMNKDGSGVTQVSFPEKGQEDHQPEWTANGEIVAHRTSYPNPPTVGDVADNGLVYTIRIEGQTIIQQQLLQGVRFAFAQPHPSPDGSQIALQVHESDDPNDFQVYVADADGDNLTQLTSGPGFNGNPAWVKLASAGPPPSEYRGDVNCDGNRTAVDAALILQVDAGLLPPQQLPCPQNADVNRDGRTNSIDAALVQQDVAGLYQIM